MEKGNRLAGSHSFMSKTAHFGGREIAYVTQCPGEVPRHAENLQAFGFSVCTYTSVVSACSASTAEYAQLIVLQTESVSLHLAVAQLRSAFCRAAIVVVADYSERLSRVSAMLSGADICVDNTPDSLELAAALLALERRLSIEELRSKNDKNVGAGVNNSVDRVGSESRPQASGHWHLRSHCWVLVAPNGTAIELSHAERRIMIAFSENPENPVTRTSQDASPEGGENSKVGRGLDVTISRLRRKAAAHDLRLPIRTIWGGGYVFASDEALIIDPAT